MCDFTDQYLFHGFLHIFTSFAGIRLNNKTKNSNMEGYAAVSHLIVIAFTSLLKYKSMQMICQ